MFGKGADMADKVIRGYWDCPQCGTKGIDGLVDVCPNCGSGKDKNVRYYMKQVEEVSDEELENAGLSREESDGSHREWICAYCGNLNNFRDKFCVHCGASREEKQQDYAGDTASVQYEMDSQGNLHRVSKEEEPKKESYKTKEDVILEEELARKRGGSPLRWVVAAVLLLLAAYMLWPHTTAEAITGFAWNRSVTVEELRTFSEEGWSLPQGARQTDARRELYGYDQVLDHYETTYVTRTRQVVDHYETSYTYTDNGNGTFSEHEVRTPVYTTETYQEPVREPVYRSVPHYETKYYYEIDRWVSVQEYKTSGEDHDPYWSTSYTLAKNQRDTERSEEYYTIYNENDVQRVSHEKWESQDLGDGIYVTRCRLGIEYSRREQE